MQERKIFLSTYAPAQPYLNLCTAQLNAKVPHDTGQLLPVDEPIAILVHELISPSHTNNNNHPIKYLESFSYFILSILSIRLEAHHHQELWEVKTASAILVYLVDHVLYLMRSLCAQYLPNHTATSASEGFCPTLLMIVFTPLLSTEPPVAALEYKGNQSLAISSLLFNLLKAS